MVIVLVILTILAFVLADVLLARRGRGLAGEEVLALGAATSLVVPVAPLAREAPSAALAEGLNYHPGHTWARCAEEGLVAVGLDDLAAKVVGRIEGVRLPAVGEEVSQGTPAWTISRRGRTMRLVSPVTGVVVEVNDHLRRDPELINRSPYSEGWAFKARLSRVKEDLKSLYAGAHAKKFMDLARTWICFSFSPPSTYYQLTYQDGGELIEGLGDRLGPEAWEKLRRDFFLTD